MKLKRLLCGILAAFLISYSPITSYAAATSIAVTAGSYVINLILNACGIDFSLSSNNPWRMERLSGLHG